MTRDGLSIAITGAGGAGAISCGEMLLRAWAAAGGRGLLRKAFGPQIRGGEAAALLTLTDSEDYTAATHYDLLLALDWLNFERFEDEIRLADHAAVVCESPGDAPEFIKAARFQDVAFKQLAADSHPEGRSNMLALGLLGRALELPVESLCELAEQRLASRPQAYRDAARAGIEAGFELELSLPRPAPARGEPGAWCMSGNQAAAYGALDAGIRFVAAYPITPASDLLEWMAGPLEQLGGHLVQAEDELAAINMALGASFGGVPAFTATSGPGLALMSESIGLAVASETPVCIVNVQRGGPSTGIPTKSEQSDLDIALHGLHGDAPHLVLAPLDIGDCVFTTGWAVHLAAALQTPAIVLSDQFLGQSTAVVSEPRRHRAEPGQVVASDGDYLRYRLTASGVSAMAVPGDSDRRFTADGLEHNERGTPSASQTDHQQQLDKRRHKLDAHEFGEDWAEVAGEGELALLCFGSSAAAVRAAAARLARSGTAVRSVAIRLLAPLPVAELHDALEGCSRALVVEQNHSAQLFHYLRSQMGVDVPLRSYARPGPVPLNPDELCEFINQEMLP
ncbi:MAG: 2-oxoacid:acceptor oxidoreductase subunit alpha [Halieaceae bacterium]|nr:2-oxoacid:acceptor oxidoreductase subunit alpha [Halieaceae bacterium]